MPTLKPLAALLLLSLSVACHAQSRDSLEKRKAQLEEELAKVNRKLEELVRAAAPKEPVDPDEPTHYIEKFGVWDVNSAGGVEPTITIRNANKNSHIKYAYVSMQLYDRVGVRQSSSIGGVVTGRLNITGPLSFYDQPYRALFDPIWYNHGGWCVTITAIRIEFLDGSAKSFSGANVAKALKPGLSNRCPVNGPQVHE